MPVVAIVRLWTMSVTPTLAVRGGAANRAIMRRLKSSRSSCAPASCFVASMYQGGSDDGYDLQSFAAKRQCYRGGVHTFHSTSGTTSSFTTEARSRVDDGNFERDRPKDDWKIVDVPLVFVPGMKGSHLAFEDDDSDSIADEDKHLSTSKTTKKKKERVWLTLGNLLNFPPRPDDDPSRDLSLPLTYDYDPPTHSKGEDGANAYAAHYPRQHRGRLVPDGIVDHIIEFNMGNNTSVDLNFLPFYGHTVRDALY
jgi:hypothetical protein